MRILPVFLLVGTLNLFAASTYSQETKLSMQLNNVTLENLFDAIKSQSEFSIVVKSSEVNLNERVSVSATNETVDIILNRALYNKGLKYEIKGKHILVYKAPAEIVSVFPDVNQSGSKISGVIKDSRGEPIIGANVIVKGTTNGTMTDIDGKFNLSDVKKGDLLEISYIGYVTQLVRLTGQSSLQIELKENAQALEEVVVVGYGTQKKANLTGAVDKISSNTISALQVNTVGEALQGQIANLNVGIADGKPGRAASFNIRGTTSLNGGSPLIIIDGVPSNDTQLNSLSPRDIEDISVLKDASSAAIYGARGAFGVILVQTKHAKAGEFKINYTNNFGWSKSTRVLEPYDNAADYLDIIQNEFNNNIGQYGVLSDAELEYAHQVAADPSLPRYKFISEGGQKKLVAGGHVNDFYHEWFDTYAPKQSHHLSVSGGSDKIQYFVSGDFNHETGLLKLKSDKINRYTIHSNIIYNINKHISIFNNSYFTIRNDDLPNMYVTSWRSNIWRWMEMFNHALWPSEIEIDGKPYVTESGFLKQFISNYSKYTKKRHETSNTWGADVSLLNNELKIHGDFTYQFANMHTVKWGDVTGVGKVWADNNSLLAHYGANSYFQRTMDNTRSMSANAYATYEKNVLKNHFKVMGGFNWEDYDYIQEYAQRMDPLSLNVHSLNLGTGTLTSTDNDYKYANQSTFFRFNYDFDGRYLLEMNGCYNISSRFPSGKRDHVFSSISAGWRISEESFFKSMQKTINNLKLRASYGSLGNQNIGAYDYLSMLSVSQSVYNLEGSQVNYTMSPTPKSSNFTWETARTIDGGIDISILNKLSASFDWYQRTTSNMLTKYHSLPSVYGASAPQENNAKLRNRGWELSVNWDDHFSLAEKPFSYGVRFVMSDYTSKITSYYNPTNYLGDYYKGEKIGEIWGLHTLGFFKTDQEAKNSPILNTNGFRQFEAAGCIKFEDRNNDGTISNGSWTKEKPGDYYVIGNTTPRYQYGITLSAAWNGFDFNAFFKGLGKMNIYPNGESTPFWGPYSRRYVILTKKVAERRWTENNPNAYFPRPQGYIASGGDLNVAQTRYLQNASYLRLKNLVIGYTLPRALTQKVRISNLRVYLSGQNLFETTKLDSSLDPEGLTKDPDASDYVGLGTSYPVQRVYSFGVEIQF